MRRAWLFLAFLPAAAVAWIVLVTAKPGLFGTQSVTSAPPTETVPHDDNGRDEEPAYAFRIPSGEPTELSCDDARAIVDQVRMNLAYPAESVDVARFAEATSDWLDPHGLFSIAKEAPTGKAITEIAADLVADLERPERDCASVRGPALVLEKWVRELRSAFDHARDGHESLSARVAASEPLPPAGTAREIASEIGRRVGAFEAAYGPEVRTFADDARRRFFPPPDQSTWARIVLGAAVRAYVPLVDPHGEWAPFDEESRIYEVELASRPPAHLWGRVVPTAVGVRVMEGASAPLHNDDVVLSVASVSTAGLSLEQVDQLGFATSATQGPVSAVVLRSEKLLTLDLGISDEGDVSDQRPDLSTERVGFGEGDVLLVAVREVRDDLGEALAELIKRERQDLRRKLVGVVLDLRGNGGGSTDGALSAVSLFLPGSPLFSMRRRDGTIEIDRAPSPRDDDQWRGPVATLIDGSTASAAEMISGALASYRRGVSVGTPTFGKGCAQEYVDDNAHAGVLRLTTLVYALPDGTPVQRVGLTPQIRFPFSVDEQVDPDEREATLEHAAPTWRGPDLREPGSGPNGGEIAWPSHAGNVGPCADREACQALRLLGASKRAPVAKRGVTPP